MPTRPTGKGDRVARLGEELTAALDPTTAPAKGRSLSPEELQAAGLATTRALPARRPQDWSTMLAPPSEPLSPDAPPLAPGEYQRMSGPAKRAYAAARRAKQP